MESRFPVRKVVKRDGRVVDFDARRIREAIRKAMVHVGAYDEETLKKVVDHVLELIAEKYGAEKTPHVEEIQDIVELSLVKFDLYEVAKAYILYRKERERIREEKKKILEKDYVDEVDKAFSLNALRLMASRYLLKDEKGKLREGPKQMFQRVAALMVIPDILHDPEIFDKEGNQPKHPKEDFDPVQWEGKLGLGRNNGGYEITWNRWHLERMKALYDELNEQKSMRVPWSVLLKMLSEGRFEKYHRQCRKYYELMVGKKFMPNSPTLFNAGARLGQLSACFVLDIDDNIESIMDAAKDAAVIFKSGGGIGINYSKLRPEGDLVFSTFGVASGPVSFMRIIDTVTEVVKQGGKRRGANMGILESWHPDIETFIHSKEKEGFLENFNISVMLDEKFWQYYEKGEPYPLINPRDGKVWKKIDPRRLFRELAEAAWRTADPGVLFLDNINRHNPFRESMGLVRSTNPCAEQPLYPYESCNLGSINVYAFVRRRENGEAWFDWDALEDAVRTATRFLDNVIDVNKYPIPQIEYRTKMSRRIGLGIMGVADVLYALRIPYNSEEGFGFMSRLMEFIAYHAYMESVRLAEERGSFPLYWQSTYPKGEIPIEGFHHPEWWTMDWRKLSNLVKEKGIRNSHVTTVAPTGSISMLVDVSSGLEPQFALVYEKHVTVGTFYYVDLEFERQMKERGLYGDQLLKKISENGGSVQGLEEVPEDIRRVFLVAYDIPWWDHVRAQYEVQKWVDASVSKTINMPAWVTVDDVLKAYLFAYKLGLKGITIYRDTSKSSQVLVTPSQRLNKYIALTPNKTLEMMKLVGIEPPRIEGEGGEEPRKKIVQLVYAAEKEEGMGEGKEASEHPTIKIERCPTCSSLNLVYQEGCVRCLDCGWSSCMIA